MTNDPTFSGLCGSAGLFQQDCQIAVRLQNLLSGNYSSLLTVNQYNCIAYRLYKLLIWLDQQYPGQGWSNFYIPSSGGALNISQVLRWDLMAWGGHSQGGGTVQVFNKCP